MSEYGKYQFHARFGPGGAEPCTCAECLAQRFVNRKFPWSVLPVDTGPGGNKVSSQVEIEADFAGAKLREAFAQCARERAQAIDELSSTKELLATAIAERQEAIEQRDVRVAELQNDVYLTNCMKEEAERRLNEYVELARKMVEDETEGLHAQIATIEAINNNLNDSLDQRTAEVRALVKAITRDEEEISRLRLQLTAKR